MPYKIPDLLLLQQQQLDAALRQQELAFGLRYDALVGQLHQVQANNNQYKTECEHLRMVLQSKQDAITLLLLSHLPPITPELQRQIDLT